MDRTKRRNKNRALLQRTKHHSIWNACREAQQAARSRKAQESERLKAAALELGFTKNMAGVWAVQCPGCENSVQLYTTRSGDISADSPNPRCAMLDKLRAHLRKGGVK
jgi:hypothetical protein